MNQEEKLPIAGDPDSPRYACSVCGRAKDDHALVVDVSGAVCAGSYRDPNTFALCAQPQEVLAVLFCFHDPIKKTEGGDPYAHSSELAAIRPTKEAALAWCAENGDYEPHNPFLWWWFEIERWPLQGSHRHDAQEKIGIVGWDGASLPRAPVEGYPRPAEPTGAKVIRLRGLPPPPQRPK